MCFLMFFCWSYFWWEINTHLPQAWASQTVDPPQGMTSIRDMAFKKKDEQLIRNEILEKAEKIHTWKMKDLVWTSLDNLYNSLDDIYN